MTKAKDFSGSFLDGVEVHPSYQAAVDQIRKDLDADPGRLIFAVFEVENGYIVETGDDEEVFNTTQRAALRKHIDQLAEDYI